MWLAIKAFFASNAVKVVEWAVIVGSAAASVLAIFNAGKKSEKTAELQKTLDNVEEAHAIQNTNSALSDADVSNKLRSDWGK